MYEFPDGSAERFKTLPHGIFAAGGANVPTQEKKKKKNLGL